MDGLVLAADDAEDVECAGDRVGAHGGVEIRDGQRIRCGDAVVVDDGFLGNLQRHFAHVPAGEVGGVEGLAGGHGVTDGLAESVPGVAAGVGEARDAFVDVKLVCHGLFPFVERVFGCAGWRWVCRGPAGWRCQPRRARRRSRRRIFGPASPARSAWGRAAVGPINAAGAARRSGSRPPGRRERRRASPPGVG